MKITPLLLSFLLLASLTGHCDEKKHPIDSSEIVREISVAAVAEDATSMFYYFFYSRKGGDQIEKVRILWNGGAQNPPTVKDFYLDGNNITVIERGANRTDLPVLLRGEDAGLTTKSEMQFKSESAKVTLSKEQSMALGNLIDALSRVREALPPSEGKTKESKTTRKQK